MNRRLYRQGMCYHIANITMHDSQGNCNAKFSIAPNTWPTHTAWKLFFNAWKKQRAQVMEDSPVQSPKWADFKVYLNKEHITDGDWGKVVDDDGEDISDSSDTTNGEWDYSDISFSYGGTRKDNMAIGLLGNHSIASSITNEESPDDTSYDGYVSILEGLQEVRRYPTDDGTVDTDLEDSILVGMNLHHSLGVEDQILQLEDEGDKPPYPVDFVGGSDNPADDTGAFPVRHLNIASTYSPIAQVGGFPVPCGLMQIKTVCSSENTVGMIIELAPGSYKGVAALPMGE